jgi:hypothetical protein
MFENMVLGRIFGPKRDEISGKWRKRHNVKLNDLCPLQNIFSDDQIKKNEIGEALSMLGKRRGAYRVWWGNLREWTTWKTQAYVGG